MPRHAQTREAAAGVPAAAPPSHRRQSRSEQSRREESSREETHRGESHRRQPAPSRRRPSRVPRTALAVCCTALAAGAGGIFSGVLPLPPGVPASVVVAGDPAGQKAIASQVPAGAGAPVAGRTPGRNPVGGGGGHGSARPTPSARTSPTAAPTPTPSPSATTAAPSASATPPSTAPSGSATASPVVGTAADQVLALVNAQRVQHGCAALTASAPLTALAQAFSVEMDVRNFFDHTDPDGKTPWDRAKALGITNLGGENIAMGQQTPEDVMTAWMNSPGHRANILNCSYHSLGVGVQFATGAGPWWTEDFGF